MAKAGRTPFPGAAQASPGRPVTYQPGCGKWYTARVEISKTFNHKKPEARYSRLTPTHCPQRGFWGGNQPRGGCHVGEEDTTAPGVGLHTWRAGLRKGRAWGGRRSYRVKDRRGQGPPLSRPLPSWAHGSDPANLNTHDINIAAVTHTPGTTPRSPGL